MELERRSAGAARRAGTLALRLPMVRHNGQRDERPVTHPRAPVRRRAHRPAPVPLVAGLPPRAAGGALDGVDGGRPGPGAAGPGRGGRRRRTPSAAADRGRARGPGAVGVGGGRARRERHRAGLRRHRRRPDARPGLRPRAGALLRDGLPPPRHGRPALGDLRRGHPGDRPLHPHHGLAPGRGAGVAAAGARDARCADGVRRGRERLHRGPLALRARGGVQHPGPDRPRLHARGVAAGRLARLAQGDGVGPARQHGGRGRPGAALPRPQRGRGRRALAGLRRRGAPADRLRRRCRRRRLRAERHGQRDPQPPPSGVPPWRRGGTRARAGPGRSDARAGRQGARHRQQLVGRRRRAQRHR